MSFAVLIPARLASTRLPEKVLAPVGSRTLLQCVYERAQEIPGAEDVLVLTDSDRVASHVRGFGGAVLRTRADHPSGTDRCAEAAASLEVDVVVNLQGDEPLFEPRDIAALAAAAAEEGADMATLGHPFANDAQRASEHAVKVLVDGHGFATGFQRAWPDEATCRSLGAVHVWHHLGVYAFRRPRLRAFPDLPPTEAEQRERLEQLRAMGAGWGIRVLPSSEPAFGVDTQEDLDELRRRVLGPDAPVPDPGARPEDPGSRRPEP